MEPLTFTAGALLVTVLVLWLVVNCQDLNGQVVESLAVWLRWIVTPCGIRVVQLAAAHDRLTK